MKERSVKTFLHVSNALISVLCVFAILAFFVAPVFRMRISVKPTGETIRRVINAADSGAETDGLIGVALDSLEKAGIKVDLTFSVSTASLIKSIFTRGEDDLENRIDDAVDQIVQNAEALVSDTVPKAVEAVAKDLIKAEIVEIAGKAGVGGTPGSSDGSDADKAYDEIMNDLGSDGKKKAESLIDRIIAAITADGATVSSVADTIVSGFDEAAEILSGSEKYSGYVQKLDDNDRNEIKSDVSEFLKPFADENGNILMKDKLLEILLESANDAVSERSGADKNGASVVLLGAKSGEKTSSKTEAAEQLKEKLKKVVRDNIPDVAVHIIHLASAAAGVLTLIALILLAYPLIRTLTKIGADNPGFCLAAPILGGIPPFVFAVIIPSAAVAILGSGFITSALPLPGKLSAADVSAILSSVSVRFTSSSILAFAVGVLLLIFCFIYGHYRRKLKKALKNKNA